MDNLAAFLIGKKKPSSPGLSPTSRCPPGDCPRPFGGWEGTPRSCPGCDTGVTCTRSSARVSWSDQVTHRHRYELRHGSSLPRRTLEELNIPTKPSGSAGGSALATTSCPFPHYSPSVTPSSSRGRRRFALPWSEQFPAVPAGQAVGVPAPQSCPCWWQLPQTEGFTRERIGDKSSAVGDPL